MEGSYMLEPTWKIEQKGDGPTLVVGGYTMHPGDLPKRTARMQAMELATAVMRQGGKRVILVGFGLGYLAEELLYVLPPDIELIVWDCLPVAPLERNRKLRELEGKVRVVHVEEEVLMLLEDHTYVVPHSAATDLFLWEISMCEAKINRDQMKSVKAVSKRSAEFLQWLPKIGLVQEHYKAGLDRACVIVSPGPELNLDLVKKAQELNYPIICCAQALEKLNEAGITPDITVCLDPQPAIFEHLEKGKNPGWIYADAMSDGRIWEKYHEKAFAFSVPTAHCHALVWRELGYDWMEVPSVTVSELMLEIAWKLGFAAVVTSGVDYFSKERTERMKLELKGGIWSDAHYYAGSRAWRYMLRKFGIPWMAIETFFERKMPQPQEKLVLTPPSTKVPMSLVNFHLQQMLSQQPEQIQQELLKQIPEGCRADFTPIHAVGVPVVKQA